MFEEVFFSEDNEMRKQAYMTLYIDSQEGKGNSSMNIQREKHGSKLETYKSFQK